MGLPWQAWMFGLYSRDTLEEMQKKTTQKSEKDNKEEENLKKRDTHQYTLEKKAKKESK